MREINQEMPANLISSLPDFMDGHRPLVRAQRHAVSAGHYLAAQAAMAILEAGGNAIDAGVAGGITLGVVQSDLVNVAGVAPIMIYHRESDRVITIAGLGGWPKAADINYFIDHCEANIATGIRRTVIPAAPDAWITALKDYGTMNFADVAGHAISHARDGFVMYPLMAEVLDKYQDRTRQRPANAEVYLPGGKPPAVGDIFRQTDLAASLQYMVDQETPAAGDRIAGLEAARAAFYTGDIAAKFVAFHQAEGGWLTRGDLAGYHSEILPPVRVRFGDLEVYTCGPWTQGPMLAQALRLLDDGKLAALGHNSPAYAHRIVEAFKLAAADRDRYFIDPNFGEVPLGALLSEPYIRARRQLIAEQEAYPGMPPAGDPLGQGQGGDRHLEERQPEALPALDTSYICVVDGDGNGFSATPSDTSHDGAMVPGTGLTPSSRGSQSWADPYHPGAVAPGKRGRLTPNPAIAMRPGKMLMPFGTPGGDVQCQAMLQVLLNMEMFQMNPQAAVEAPRFASYSFPESFAPHAYTPGRLMLEGRLGVDFGNTLAAKGHKVEWWRDWDWLAGTVCLIRSDLQRGILEAAADPRRATLALGR